jgi:predicted DNA-binding transcriptional regulator AlpA
MPRKKPAAQVEMAKKAAALKAAATAKAAKNSKVKNPKKIASARHAGGVRIRCLPPRFNPPADDDDDDESDVRLLSKPEVLDRVGVSYPTLWAWMRAGRFPRSRELGGKVCWIASEVNAWLASLPQTRLKGDAAEAA